MKKDEIKAAQAVDHHGLVRLFIVCWDDQQGLCVPMVWDVDCQGAICGGIGEKDKVAIFASRQAARKAIDISTKWNALLKSQGKPRNEDFEGECRKNLRVVECLPNVEFSSPPATAVDKQDAGRGGSAGTQG